MGGVAARQDDIQFLLGMAEPWARLVRPISLR